LISTVFLTVLSGLLPLNLLTFAQGTEVVVSPQVNVANPGENFTVSIIVQDVVDLHSWQITLEFDGDVLDATIATEGPFIVENTTSPQGTYFNGLTFRTRVEASCSTLGVDPWTLEPYPGVPPPGDPAASGTILYVNFTVKSAGESALDLSATTLLDHDGSSIIHSASDGSFYTTAPAATFTFSPDSYGRPIVGENVTFDASASFDPSPGGFITEYLWDFDDGTNGTGVVINHTFNEPSSLLNAYNVTLTVTDNDNENTTFFIETAEEQVHIYFHNLRILEFNAPDEIHTHEVAEIEVMVLNNGSHVDSFNVTTYINFQPVSAEMVEGLLPGDNETVTFYWNTFVNQTMESPSDFNIGLWTYPLNASASDDVYAETSTNASYVSYIGYDFDPVGWTGVSKVEVGIEARTEAGGDDQVKIKAYNSKEWGEEHIYNITSTTDTFFWVDVTGNLTWEPGLMNRTRVIIEYNQIGGVATPIYLDWLPVRITPLNPADIPVGTYALWVNTYLVDPYTRQYRAGEEQNLTDNMVLGESITVTQIPVHDIAVTTIEVEPTELAFGRTTTVTVEVENNGNLEETFGVFLYANSTQPISNQTGIRLAAGATRELTFEWIQATNTTAEGTYNITLVCGLYNGTSGNIDLLTDETNTTNNKQSLFKLIQLLPVSHFTHSPSQPDIDEEVTFNASASYCPGQPGGTITSYIWDFGDGESATGVTATHTYSSPGSYSVSLIVVDDEDLNSTRVTSVTVPKLSSTITISASSVTVPLSLNTTISGSISPVRNNMTVTINFTRVGQNGWLSLANISTDESSQYSFAWEPEQDGSYQFIAFWQGDDLTAQAESSLLNVTVTIQDIAVVELVLSKIKVVTGESLTIDVTASNKGTATETFNVAVYYNDTLLETQTSTNLAAGSSETLTFSWDTQELEEGVYMVQAMAESLPGETYTADNSMTGGVVLGEFAEAAAPLDIFLYTTIGLAVVIAVMAFFLLRMMRSKPK
jgi:PKD repeat protein